MDELDTDPTMDDEIHDAEEVDMADNLPAVPARQTSTGIEALNQALLMAGDQAIEVAKQHDYESLAYGYNQLKGLSRELGTLLKMIEQLIIQEGPKHTGSNGKEYNDTFHVEGAGTFEVKRRGATRKWDSEELLRHLVGMSMFDWETGEAATAEQREAVERLVSLLTAAVPFTASLGWRLTALEELGVQADEFYEESRPAGYSLKHTGGTK